MAEYTLIEAKTLKELRKKLVNSTGFIVVNGGNEAINRFALENERISILLSPENNSNKDFMHARNSGLNQVLCGIAKKNNKSIGINFNLILEMSRNERLVALGRIMQNIKLCNKYRIKTYIVNVIKNWYDERSAKDLKSLGTLLGLNANEDCIIKINHDKRQAPG